MGLPRTSRPQKAADTKAETGIRPFGNRWFWLLLLLLAAVMGTMLVFGHTGLYHLYQLRQERDRLLASNLSLRDENETMLKAIDRLQHDREFIEDIIRRELNYIKANEIIFQLAPEVGAPPQSLPAPGASPPAAKVSRKPSLSAPLPARNR